MTTLRYRLLAHAIVITALLAIAATARAGGPYPGCEPEPVTPSTPTGIAGCEVFGSGIASHYGPGGGVAMNFCTWERRHSTGCGSVTIRAATGLTATVPVVDFCDCYTGTADERVVDLQYAVLAQLGLDPARGLYPVQVWREGESAMTLPDTSMSGYTSMSRVELQSVRLRREASPVLNPLVAPRSVIEVEQ